MLKSALSPDSSGSKSVLWNSRKSVGSFDILIYFFLRPLVFLAKEQPDEIELQGQFPISSMMVIISGEM